MLVFLPVFLGSLRGVAQSGIVISEGQTYTLGVQPTPGYTYEWIIYDETDLTTLATNDEIQYISSPDQATVDVLWKKSGVYFYKIIIHSDQGCMNYRIGKATVQSSLPTAVIAAPNPICTGDSTQLQVTLTGLGPWSITLSDGSNTIVYDNITSSPAMLLVNPTSTTNYQIMQVTDMNGTNSTPGLPVQLMVKPRPVSSHIYQY